MRHWLLKRHLCPCGKVVELLVLMLIVLCLLVLELVLRNVRHVRLELLLLERLALASE